MIMFTPSLFNFCKKEYKVVDTININDIKVTKGKLLVSSNNLEVKIDTKSRVYRFKCKNINEANNIIEQIKEYKLSESIFKSADALAVYKDARLFSTFKDTMKALQDGFDVVIFPENPKEYNEIVNDFQLHFVDVAKLYYGKYKKE